MTALLALNALMLLLAVGIATRIVPQGLYSGLLEALHITIGITTPPPEKMWLIAVIWIVSITVISNGLLLVFFFLLHQLK